MTSVITGKTEAVMTRLASPDQEAELRVTFVSSYEDTGVIYRCLIINYNEWVDLGSPDQITITVVPGDTLNG